MKASGRGLLLPCPGEQIRAGLAQQSAHSLSAAAPAAQTMEEIRRLEDALKSGQVPSEFQVQGDGAMADGEQQQQQHAGSRRIWRLGDATEV